MQAAICTIATKDAFDRLFNPEDETGRRLLQELYGDVLRKPRALSPERKVSSSRQQLVPPRLFVRSARISTVNLSKG